MNVEFIELVIGANNALMGQKYGPILGQHGLNIKLFCDNFNELSKNIYKNIPLRILILVNKDKSFEIKFKGIDRKFFYNFYIKDNKILFKDLYNILLIEEYFKNKYISLDLQTNLNFKSNIKIMLNYLKKNKVIILYN